mgnify:CR=1 FL=1
MAKRKLPKEVYCDTENSDEEFYFDSLNTDSDVESDNVGSDSGSDIVPLKRQVRQLVISSEVEENDDSSVRQGKSKGPWSSPDFHLITHNR